MELQRTFLALKPDCIQRGLCSEVIKRFEQRGYKLVGMKMIQPTKELLEEHYIEHKGRPFLKGLVEYMMSGPIIAMVWEGLGVIEDSRRIIGATRPKEAGIGTIRGDLCIDVSRNLIHGSDGIEAAKREINIWFKKEEIADWEMCSSKYIQE